MPTSSNPSRNAANTDGLRRVTVRRTIPPTAHRTDRVCSSGQTWSWKYSTSAAHTTSYAAPGSSSGGEPSAPKRWPGSLDQWRGPSRRQTRLRLRRQHVAQQHLKAWVVTICDDHLQSSQLGHQKSTESHPSAEL
eukprot:CAMPEP_0114311124 /NCGR_PEP_ID=MMETSP0059-20121206/19645_1 /TAXON_ID=36894 /ORGANISM="Pyramimonas parkeae, Strain CCMP726" /LENGTH=134 /DNA_ID=CAMNT_0001435253 /DNA_START=403 /DNA_END=807 /DNA_ORIENTATION=+